MKYKYIISPNKPRKKIKYIIANRSSSASKPNENQLAKNLKSISSISSISLELIDDNNIKPSKKPKYKIIINPCINKDIKPNINNKTIKNNENSKQISLTRRMGKQPQINDRHILDLKTKYFKPFEKNLLIAELLDKLVIYIECEMIDCTYDPLKKSHMFRSLSLKKASRAIRNYPYQINTVSDAIQVHGVGEGTLKRVAEILRTGTLIELKMDVSESSKAITELCTISGIGHVFAKKIVNKYLSTKPKDQKIVDYILEIYRNTPMEIESISGFSHNMSIGFRYYEDLLERMSRDKIKGFIKMLKELIQDINPNFVVKCCGSYRRKKQTIGDIDILVMDPANKDWIDIVMRKDGYFAKIIGKLRKLNIVVDVISYGSSKFMGICMVDGKARHIDILYVPRDSYVYGLCYFTGSDMLNRLVRAISIRRGYCLNNWGMYQIKDGTRRRKFGEYADKTVNNIIRLKDPHAPEKYLTGYKIPVASEKEIFDILGLKYLDPIDRE
jgi:DNA polymerase/3'-5' exonuclease PolX